ncbi:hypothetical protein, unlikely [Trypanosoma brucei gambiense DAL972]|uniref:Uncharacterized protein n=1 Tax=Trypanosoma brucei gambiense (strain MHOM/CI/86/DAL972) TaxID=679716 RepID=D0A3I8_TRYB9|nr:hypothetical protein, unlikely [Trypanosoma brucei gambiense DAL972]CBH15832.1 hypothetical protein, unlikely [Trypanosoma brucei gambiense DAL972]|eukprot:XP_011778096.1 hypothetical protein, unlikely [Trypanosoma brucei gambiense DAL972]
MPRRAQSNTVCSVTFYSLRNHPTAFYRVKSLPAVCEGTKMPRGEPLPEGSAAWNKGEKYFMREKYPFIISLHLHAQPSPLTECHPHTHPRHHTTHKKHSDCREPKGVAEGPKVRTNASSPFPSTRDLPFCSVLSWR